MQLRKVANHPQLFGRQTVVVPFSLEAGARLLHKYYSRLVLEPEEGIDSDQISQVSRQTILPEPSESTNTIENVETGLHAFRQREQLRELADVVAAFAELEDETKTVLARDAQLRARVGLRSGLEYVIPGPVMEMVSGLGPGERVLRFCLGESVLASLRENYEKSSRKN